MLAFSAAVLRAEIPRCWARRGRTYVKDIGPLGVHGNHARARRHRQSDPETVTRYDPSQPYAEQFTILSQWKTTDKEQVKQACQRGGARAKRWAAGRSGERCPVRAHPQWLSGTRRPRACDGADETAQSVTDSVPMRAERSKGFPWRHFRRTCAVTNTERPSSM